MVTQFAGTLLTQLQKTFIEVKNSYENKHYYGRNAGNESSAIQLYTKTKLKVQVTKYLLDFIIFFAAKRKPLRKNDSVLQKQ